MKPMPIVPFRTPGASAAPGKVAFLFLLLLVGLLRSGAESAEPAAGDPSLTPMRARIEQFIVDTESLERRETIGLSAERGDRLRRHYQSSLESLGGVPFDSLDQEGKVDYLLLKSHLVHESRALTHLRQQVEEIKDLVPFAPRLIQLEEDRRRMKDLDSRQAAEVVSGVAEEVSKTRKGVAEKLKGAKEGAPAPVSKVLGQRAARHLDQLRGLLREWRDFYAGYDPEFTWWLRQPYEKCDHELQEYGSYLRREVVGMRDGEEEPLVGDPIGRQALLDALEAEMIPYSPEELIDIANREFEWCDAEWRRAAKDLGFGGEWRKALDHVAGLHVKPGEQPRLIRELADESVRFLEERELVTIPSLCKEIWRMEMMTPERQKVSPYFTGGEVISISFPTDTMSHEDKVMSLRGNNIHFCRATVQHELIPGHHLQSYMAARYRTHRRVFSTPFLVEGWALYWEMRLWDLGFPKTAEDRVGMLFWRTHRCARILFSLKFHLGEMTPQQAVDFLVERVGHERRNATAEVRRSIAGGYGPLYQAAYMLGGLQLRSLQKEMVGTGKMTERAFHDAVLRENAIPIEMIRADLLRLPLTREAKPAWKFR
ncbi:MAG TPA: DUF885 domain-containing protein [Verrucomicrobiales bacterium]|nr:DUF885 domain-containing protein [Verrucomicrobiales bacterium]